MLTTQINRVVSPRPHNTAVAPLFWILPCVRSFPANSCFPRSSRVGPNPVVPERLTTPPANLAFRGNPPSAFVNLAKPSLGWHLPRDSLERMPLINCRGHTSIWFPARVWLIQEEMAVQMSERMVFQPGCSPLVSAPAPGLSPYFGQVSPHPGQINGSSTREEGAQEKPYFPFFFVRQTLKSIGFFFYFQTKKPKICVFFPIHSKFNIKVKQRSYFFGQVNSWFFLFPNKYVIPRLNVLSNDPGFQRLSTWIFTFQHRRFHTSGRNALALPFPNDPLIPKLGKP